MINETLDKKKQDLQRNIYNLKHSFDVYKIINLNADKINKSGSGKSFLGFISQLIFDSFIVCFCGIMENEKKGELNSIPGILNYIKINEEKCLYERYVTDFLNKYSISSLNPDDFRKGEFYEKYNKHIGSLKAYRNKSLAHIVANSIPPQSHPSFKIMEELIEFCIDFCNMFGGAYVNVHPLSFKTDKTIASSLKDLLKNAGYENIATDFIDSPV